MAAKRGETLAKSLKDNNIKKVTETSQEITKSACQEHTDISEAFLQKNGCQALLKFLSKGHTSTPAGLQAIQEVLRAMVDLTDHDQLKMQMVADEVTLQIASELRKLQDCYTRNQTEEKIVNFCLAIILNCCTNVRDMHIYRKLDEQTSDTLKNFTDANKHALPCVVRSVVILERISTRHNLHTYIYPPNFITHLSYMMGTAKINVNFRSHTVAYPPPLQMKAGLQVVLTCCCMLATEERYRCQLIKQLEPHKDIMDDVLKRGSRNHQDQLNKLLQLLCKHSDCHLCNQSFAVSLLFPTSNGTSGDYATPVPTYDRPPPPRPNPVRVRKGDTLPNKPPPPPPTKTRPQSHQEGPQGGATGPAYDYINMSEMDLRCPYLRKCEKYLRTLRNIDIYLDRKYDRCFCGQCMDSRRETVFRQAGHPPKGYTQPKAWCRFGIKVLKSRTDDLNVFTKWHVTFHGTREAHVMSILQTGEVLYAGDKTVEGAKVTPPDNHFTEKKKPKDHNIYQAFFSPTIEYAGVNAYAKPTEYTDRVTKKKKVPTATLR